VLPWLAAEKPDVFNAYQQTQGAARVVWADLRQRGWCRATDAEINHHQMTHRRLRESRFREEMMTTTITHATWDLNALLTNGSIDPRQRSMTPDAERAMLEAKFIGSFIGHEPGRAGLTSMPSEGATDWMTANWPTPAVMAASRRTAARAPGDA
jgi:hypothetical protein